MTDENKRTFLDRCEIFFPHEEVVKVSVAYSLAKGHHANQTRKDEKNPDGTPVRYFEHVRRVSLVLMDEVGLNTSINYPILGLLHDTYEDTNLTLEEINFVFGRDIAKKVALMSKKPKVGFLDRLRNYGDFETICVKIADRIDNCRSLKYCAPEFQEKQINETLEHYLTLTGHAGKLATTEAERSSVDKLYILLKDAIVPK